MKNVFAEFVDNYINLYYKNEEDIINDVQLNSFWKRLLELFDRHIESGRPLIPRKLTLKNLKDVLSNFIFRVTGGHSQAGDAVATVLDPSCVNIRVALFDDKDVDQTLVAPFQASSIVCAVTALTALPVPKLVTDVSGIFASDSKAQKLYRTFLSKLNDLASNIAVENANRKWPCENFNPLYCNISTAV